MQFRPHVEDFQTRINSVVVDALHAAQAKMCEGSTTSRIDTWHVSDFVSPCLRKSYYNHVRKIPVVNDAKKRSVLFNGLIVHEHTKLSHFHEVTMCYDIEKDVAYTPQEVEAMDPKETTNIITGTCDDLLRIDGKFVIADKKTWNAYGYVKTVPNPEYVMQLNIYRVLLNESYNIDPEWGCLLFLDKTSDLNELPMSFPLNPINETKEFMRNALHELKGEPKPNPCWLCLGQNKNSRIYCDFIDICNLEGRREIMQSQQHNQVN